MAAKLRFGVAVARDGTDGSYEAHMFEWFDRALDDFERPTGLPVPVPARGALASDAHGYRPAPV